MTFSYTFSVRDYDEALRLHRRQKASRRVRFLLLYRILPLFCVAGLVVLGALDIRAHTLGNWILLSFAIALLWVGILGVFAPRNNVRCGFKRSAPAGQTTIRVDDECVLSQVPGISETKWFWNGFVGEARDEKLLLLYTSKDCFLIFPASGMTVEQWKELNEIVDRELPRK